jgi:hypothetical protein
MNQKNKTILIMMVSIYLKKFHSENNFKIKLFRFFKEKISSIIENSIEKSISKQMILSVNQIAIYKALEKLRQWIDFNLNENIFYQELIIKVSKYKKDLENFYKINENNELSNEKTLLIDEKNNDEFEESNLILHDIFCSLKNLFANLMKESYDFFQTEKSIKDIFGKIKQYLEEKVIYILYVILKI